MYFSPNIIDRLPTLGQGASVRVSVADWAVTGMATGTKAAMHCGHRPPGMNGGLQLKH